MGLVFAALLVICIGFLVVDVFRRPGHFLKQAARRPGEATLLIAKIASSSVFLWWLFMSWSSWSIDHIRPYGWPLGLWGLLALFVTSLFG